MSHRSRLPREWAVASAVRGRHCEQERRPRKRARVSGGGSGRSSKRARTAALHGRERSSRATGDRSVWERLLHLPEHNAVVYPEMKEVLLREARTAAEEDIAMTSAHDEKERLDDGTEVDVHEEEEDDEAVAAAAKEENEEEDDGDEEEEEEEEGEEDANYSRKDLPAFGINSCAVCGAALNISTAVQCGQCQRVKYCSTQHALQDEPVHDRVCTLLPLCVDEVSLADAERSLCDRITDALCTPAEGLFAARVLPEVHLRGTDVGEDDDELDAAEGYTEAEDPWLMLFDHIGVADEHHPYESSVGRQSCRALSFPCTVASELRVRGTNYWSHSLRRACKTGRVVVHVLGASRAELAYPEAWSIVAAALQSLSQTPLHCIIAFIGPDMDDSELSAAGTSSDGNPRITLVCSRGVYGQQSIGKAAARASEAVGIQTVEQEVAQPSLLVGFHMGVSIEEYPWDESLQYLLEKCKGVPLLATTFTHEEMQRDRAILVDDFFFNCVEESERNAWASPVPVQSASLANDIYRSNAYSAVYTVPRIVPSG